jgi:VRR-NUC domain
MKTPLMTEHEFQRQVTDLAEIYGWEWAHFRPAQTARGWRTPVSGPLGAGFPDLVMVRARDRRLIFVELKRDKGKVSLEQGRVLATLASAIGGVYVWHPEDFDEIQRVLA